MRSGADQLQLSRSLHEHVDERVQYFPLLVTVAGQGQPLQFLQRGEEILVTGQLREQRFHRDGFGGLLLKAKGYVYGFSKFAVRRQQTFGQRLPQWQCLGACVGPTVAGPEAAELVVRLFVAEAFAGTFEQRPQFFGGDAVALQRSGDSLRGCFQPFEHILLEEHFHLFPGRPFAGAEGAAPLIPLSEKIGEQSLQALLVMVLPVEQDTYRMLSLVMLALQGQRSTGGFFIEHPGIIGRIWYGTELARHRHGPCQVVIETVDGANEQSMGIVPQLPALDGIPQRAGDRYHRLFVGSVAFVGRVEQLENPFAHLRRGFAGKGDGQDGFRLLHAGQ